MRILKTMQKSGGISEMNWDLYVVTDEELSHGRSHREIAIEAVKGGAGIIQLREKNKGARETYENAVAMREICKNKAIFIVNDRLDIALAAGADGVHLGQDDLPLSVARKIAGDDFIIGISVGSLEEASQAIKDGADYIAVSPVFATLSKADAGPEHGLSLVHEIHERYPDIPLIGIGGLNAENAEDAIHAGLTGIAVISAVVSQDNIAEAARNLLVVIQEAKQK